MTLTKLNSNLLVSLSHVGQVVSKVDINIFQVDTLGLEVAIDDVGAVEIDSGTVELGAEVRDSGVEVGALVGEGVVGLLEVGTLGLAGGEKALKVGTFSSACIELVAEIVDSLG